jgi:hypothetical protein
MVEEEYGNLLPIGQEDEGGHGDGSRGSSNQGLRVLLAGFGLLVGLAACSVGETPPPPSEALTTFVGSGQTEVIPVAPGLAYYGITNTTKPWAIHLLRMELSRCELGLRVLEAPVGAGDGLGRSPVTDLVVAAGDDVLAGVNADFFTPEGAPVGTEVVDGEVRRVRNRPAFGWRAGKNPWMGMPVLEGDSNLLVGWNVPRPTGDGETQVVGGFPLLLSDGARIGDLEVADRPSFAAERHPRTAVGFDADEDLLWVVVVDGRQPGHSMGMSLPELAGLFEALGVEDAVNLDGGGSTVMVLGGEAVSSPSDAEGERPVANALGIVQDAGYCARGR